MSNVETAVKSKITEGTRTLAEKLKAEITIDAGTGTTAPLKDVFAANLPEGLTMDHVEAVFDYQDTLIKAGGLALGEAANAVMKDNKDLARVTMTIPTVGKNYLGFAYDRSRQVPTRNEDGTTGTREKFGALTVDVVTYGTKNRGEFAHVKNELSENALAAFGKSK